MPVTLLTVLNKIATDVPNKANQKLLQEFYQYLKGNGTSENYQIGNLKAMIQYACFLGSHTSFNEVNKREQIVLFLDSKIKSSEVDPDKKWITTWNDYLWRLKLFLRWLHNQKHSDKTDNEDSHSDWVTPPFAKIKKRRTKRLSPYLESEIWEQDEFFSIIKYEPRKRNKAALSMMWDLDARNHEITLLQMKHLRIRERYAEGQIPDEAKTGSGPFVLTASFPYVRDWLNEHPFKNDREAYVICNISTGKKIRPEELWRIMKRLRARIIGLLAKGSITGKEEIEKLQFLLKTKKWNPYCIRHSAITADSDHLTEYQLKRKARWSINSRQGARYIKNRWSTPFKVQLLTNAGIITEEALERQTKPSVLNCPKCGHVNAIENKYCSNSTCGYVISQQGLDEIKAEERAEMAAMEEKYEKFAEIREEMQTKFRLLYGRVDDEKLIDPT